MTQRMIPAWIDGVLTPAEKLSVHHRGLRHRAVSVFVLDRSGGALRLLIQKRAAGKYHTPGLWANTCCTHPDWDEAPLDCAMRRLAEELGIAGLSPVFRDTVEYRAEVGGGMVEHEVVDIFTAEAGAGLSVTPHPDEVAEVRWIALPDLVADIVARPAAYTPWLRIYLDRHAAAIFGP